MYLKQCKRIAALAMIGALAISSVSVGVSEQKEAVAAAKKTKTDKLFGGGKGTKKNPYQIKTVKQFKNIGKNTTTLKKNYVLKKNLNFKNKTIKSIGMVTMSDMMKGDMSKAFSGTFDGKNHTLSNIKVGLDKGELGTGIFEIITGAVKNLKVKNVTSNGTKSAMFAGGVIGMANGGSVTSVKLTGKNSITGTNCIGGVVGGGNYTNISKCSVVGTTINVIGDNNFATGIIEQEDVAECGGLVVGGGFGGQVSNCTATGTVQATGNEPVGLGGIGGCLQCMDVVSDNTADVIIKAKNGHAVGGLCGYAGVGDDGDGVVQDPATIKNCNITVKIVADGATHVGGLVGTGLYFYNMEDRFNIVDCSVKGSIDGAVTPGTVAGRAEGSKVTSCTTDVTVNGIKSDVQIGTTTRMYQSGDHYAAGSDQAAAYQFKNVAGTYQGLFETICDAKYYDTWKKYVTSVVGEAAADETVKILQGACTGKYYGEEAVEKYKDHPETVAFNCSFIQGISKIKVEGNKINGFDVNGKEVFAHEYVFDSYNEDLGMGIYTYKTNDADAGEFTYMCFAGDTPATTYHIEFRYGSDKADLSKYAEGKYAYWLAAGIPENASEAMIDHVIQLFVIENLTQES